MWVPVQTPHDHDDDPLAELYDDEPLARDDMPHEFDSDVEERYTGNGHLWSVSIVIKRIFKLSNH